MSVLLYSGETWDTVKQHISPLPAFPDELLATHLWHILGQSYAKCCHTEQVQDLICAESAARQKTQLARSSFQDA